MTKQEELDKLNSHGSNYRPSRREMFAMAALQGFCANAAMVTLVPDAKEIAAYAVEYADELLKKLEP